jgi:hypothetical protein
VAGKVQESGLNGTRKRSLLGLKKTASEVTAGAMLAEVFNKVRGDRRVGAYRPQSALVYLREERRRDREGRLLSCGAEKSSDVLGAAGVQLQRVQ